MDLSSPGLVKLPDKGDRDVHPSQIIDGSLTQDEDGGLKNKVMNGSGLGSTLTNGISQKEDLNDPGIIHSEGQTSTSKDKSSSTNAFLENSLESQQSILNSCDLNGDHDVENEGNAIPLISDVDDSCSANNLEDSSEKTETLSLPLLDSFSIVNIDDTKAANFMHELQSCDELNFSHGSHRASQEDLPIGRLSLYNSISRDDLPSNSIDDVVHDQGSSSQSTIDQNFRQLSNASGEMSPSLASIVDSPLPPMPPGQKSYDYLLKFLLVGDSDVGKQEILADFEDGTTDSPFCSSSGAAFKTTTILIDGKRVKLQLWDTSGQGRFCTIIRSYSRGAQGILLVYDITNKWSFEGIDRWLKEVDQHAPGIPKVLVGNRLHFEFRRQVDQGEAEEYAQRNFMGFFEVSPLVNFNISESFTELARMALKRNGMERLWRSNKVSSLYEICAHAIVNRTAVYGIHRLPLPESVKQNLKSYAMTNFSGGRPSFMGAGGGGGMGSLSRNGTAFYKSQKHSKKQHKQPLTPADAAKVNCGSGINRKSCTIS